MYYRQAHLRPCLWRKDTKLQLEEIYTRLIVVSRSERVLSSKGLEIGDHMQDIFGSSGEGQNVMVLVEGSPGIGKTTFCLKLAYDWANAAMPLPLPTFDLVFLLKCRDMDKDIIHAVMEQLLPEDIQKMTDWERFLNFITDVENQKRILIILGGLDELPEKSRHDVDKLLKRKIFPFCSVLATTRKGKGIEVREEFTFDKCLEIKGFSEDQSFEFIRKHFKSIEASKGERLIELIEDDVTFLKELTYNPLHLLILCAVFEDSEEEVPTSQPQLYQTMLRCLLRRHCARHNLKASEKDSDLEKQFESEIVTLGELAWKCLLNDRHSFSENELNVLGRNDVRLGDHGLGLVDKEESLKRWNPQHEYFFLHKTFQEYLAAFFIAHHLRRNEFNVFEQVTLNDLPRKFLFPFLFVCEMLDKEVGTLFTQISKELQGDWDLLRLDSHLLIFFSGCIGRSQNPKRVGDAIFSLFRFPRVLHLSFKDFDDRNYSVAIFLSRCAGHSMKHVPNEVHITFEFFYDPFRESAITGVDDIPNVKSLTINIKQPLSDVNELDVLYNFPSLSALTLPAISDVTGFTVVKGYLTTSKTLEKVTFTLKGETGEGWSKILDELIAGSSLSSMGLKIHGSLSQCALQDVENLLSNECLFSLPISIEGDLPDSLACLAARRTVKFLDLWVN